MIGAGTVGPLVIGAGFAVTETMDRRLPAPGPGDDPAIAALYPHRYAGTEARWSRRALAVAASWRAADWLAIGASATLAQVDLRETRRLWAGFNGRDRLGDPARDVTVALSGGDGLVPGGAIGALIAPASRAARNRGRRVVGRRRPESPAPPPVAGHGPFSVVAPAPRTQARFASPLAPRPAHAGSAPTTRRGRGLGLALLPDHARDPDLAGHRGPLRRRDRGHICCDARHGALRTFTS